MDIKGLADIKGLIEVDSLVEVGCCSASLYVLVLGCILVLGFGL